MPDWLTAAGLLDGVGTVGLVVIIGMAVFRGWLVPARLHDEIVAQYTAALEAERARADEAEERKERADKATREVLAQLLAAVPRPNPPTDPTGGGHA